MIRNKRYIAKTILLFLLLFATAKAQTVIVYSSSGKVIPEAVISGCDFSATTNDKGEFSISRFLNCDSLKISHVAFNSGIVSVKKIFRSGKVILYPKTFRTNVVRITSDKEELDKERITITAKEKAKFTGVAQLLRRKSTINIKSYGGEGSLQTVSARGMSSDNTLVLFNETKVNDLRSGSFDFSLIGINSIDDIEYYKNGVDGFAAAGGVLKLTSGRIPTANSFIIGTKTDNLLGQNYYLKTGLVHNNKSITINLERSFSRNNYSYEFEGNNRERKNADYSRFFASASFNTLFNKGFVKIYSHYSAMNNGLPGFIATNNYNSSHARSISKNILTTGNLFYRFSPKLAVKSSFGFNNQNFTISDPLNELFFFRNEETSVLNEFQFNNVFTYKYKTFNIKVGTNLMYGTMTLPNTGINSAETQYSANRSYGNVFISMSGLLTSLPLFTKVKPYVSGSYSASTENFSSDETKYSYFSYKYGFIALPNFINTLTFEFYFADNFREPNFTEIYYSRIYSNSHLKGEKYKTLNFTLNYSPTVNFNSSLSLYYIDGKDKIVWLPTRLALQIPKNFRSIKSKGLEFSSNLDLFDNKIKLNIIYVYNSVTNTYFAGAGDEAYNKQLIYSPLNRFTFGTTFNFNKFSASANFSYTDKSYYTSDNNPRFTLPAYFLTDVTLSRSFNLNGYKSRITLNVYNLFNTNYFVIQSYPMPLRSFVLDFQFGVF